MRERGRKKLLRLTLPQQMRKRPDLDSVALSWGSSRLNHTQAVFKKQKPKPVSHSYLFRLSYLTARLSQTDRNGHLWYKQGNLLRSQDRSGVGPVRSHHVLRSLGSFTPLPKVSRLFVAAHGVTRRDRS